MQYHHEYCTAPFPLLILPLCISIAQLLDVASSLWTESTKGTRLTHYPHVMPHSDADQEFPKPRRFSRVRCRSSSNLTGNSDPIDLRKTVACWQQQSAATGPSNWHHMQSKSERRWPVNGTTCRMLCPECHSGKVWEVASRGVSMTAQERRLQYHGRSTNTGTSEEPSGLRMGRHRPVGRGTSRGSRFNIAILEYKHSRILGYEQP